jgi:Domain of unknown function (DUF222)
MSELRPALDEFRSVDWSELSDGAVGDRLDEVDEACGFSSPSEVAGSQSSNAGRPTPSTDTCRQRRGSPIVMVSLGARPVRRATRAGTRGDSGGRPSVRRGRGIRVRCRGTRLGPGGCAGCVRPSNDVRTPTQRRADALGDVCSGWLASLERPTVAGERPNVVVTMDIATLEGRAGRRAELDHAGGITPETARRLACDADVTRVVTEAARSRSSSVGAPRSCHPGSAARSPFGTAGAASPAADVHLGGAIRIMLCTGPTAARPRSATSSCSVVLTIGRSIEGST